MDIKEIKQLIRLMVDNDLSELDIADGELEIHFKRGGASPAPIAHSMAPMVHAPVTAPIAAAAAPAAAKPADNLLEVKSPMVGTFYAAPSPDSEPYVAVGQSITDDSVVCIVEAMKVMNEIKAECAGTITEVCVKNAQPVEFGQVLFRVKPV
ncbi:MAG TPA: acetyl-CoA carboxylase biotin carboxyl carrier protein [Phycisphaerae bacterium]|nr:acetyl-CoA carboxylase biotin carboxyl carrier protein [Phycisphaerae bacterium]